MLCPFSISSSMFARVCWYCLPVSVLLSVSAYTSITVWLIFLLCLCLCVWTVLSVCLCARACLCPSVSLSTRLLFGVILSVSVFVCSVYLFILCPCIIASVLTLKLAGGFVDPPPPLGFFGLKFLPLDQLPNVFAQLFFDKED